MLSIDRWQEIYGTIRRNKLRTFLTALSVAWGIFMLVILLGAGRGLQNSVAYKFRDDAVNSIWIRPGKTSLPYRGHAVGRPIQFTNDDFDTLARMRGVEYITGRLYLRGEFTISYKDRHGAFDVRSVHPDHKYLEKTIMTSGRYINDLDVENRRKVVVIGVEVVKALYRPKEEPLGTSLNLGGIPYTVVGVFRDEGGEGEMRKVYIPISTAQMAYNKHNVVNQIMFTIGDANMADSVRLAQQATSILAARHNFAVQDKRALRVRNNLEQFQEIQEIFVMIRIFVWIVGIGTIIAGIVGVSNIMLISVKERTKEIGLRKAVGATPWSLVSLIVQEAVVLTAVAGYCGLIAGVGALELFNKVLPENDYLRHPEVDLSVVFGATLLLVFFGAMAGLFPALRAARVNPIVALREE